MTQDRILLFDGVCVLCNASVRFIIRHDKKSRIKFAAFQSSAGKEFIKNLLTTSVKSDTILYFTQKKLLTKSAAALTILRDIGGIWKMFYIFMIVPAFIRDWAYSLVARVRYRIFGQLDSCMIPDPGIKDRFLT